MFWVYSHTDNYLYKRCRFIVVDDKFKTFTKEFVFGNNDYCILFLKNKNKIGHWTLIHYGNKYIEYFDSLGGMDDNVYHFIRNQFPDFDVRLGGHQFQSKRSSICGKYVILRIMTRYSMNIKKFSSFLTNQSIL